MAIESLENDAVRVPGGSDVADRKEEAVLERRAAWGMAILAAALVLLARHEVKVADGRLYDLRVQLQARLTVRQTPLAVIALDDDSLARLESSVGRWPWPRAVWASVVEYASLAPVIAFDILFPEEDRAYPGSDLALAASAEHHGRVVAAVFAEAREQTPVPPYPLLADALRATGHVHIEAEADGVVRRYPPALSYEGEPLPTLAHAVAAAYRDVPVESLPGLDGFWLFPAVPRPEVYSAADVIDAWRTEQSGREPALSREVFRDRIVLIGSLATGLPMDRERTSLHPSEAGVFIVATAVDNILSGRFNRRSPAWLEDILILLLAGAPLLISTTRPWRFAAQALALPVLYAALAVGAALGARVMLPMLGPMLSGAVSATGLLVLHWGRDRRARLHLEAMEAAKQRFTDMLVHDLRNRMFSTRASLQLLSRKIETQLPEGRELALVAGAGLQRMAVEVQTLLDIRKMEEGRLPLMRERFAPEALVREVAGEYASAAAATDMEIRVWLLPGAPAEISADRGLLARVLGNLLFNALQHARPGTPLVMGCGPVSPGVSFFVANRGPVLPDAARSVLFQPFAARPDADRSRGSGLGLTLCKLVAEAHGGELRIESPWAESGDGVKVLLRLPTGIDAAALLQNTPSRLSENLP